MEQVLEELKGLKSLISEQQIFSKEIMPLVEAAKYLGISKSTLYKMTFENKINHYKPSGKLIYFKKEDLNNYLLKNKVKSNDELESEIESKLL